MSFHLGQESLHAAVHLRKDRPAAWVATHVAASHAGTPEFETTRERNAMGCANRATTSTSAAATIATTAATFTAATVTTIATGRGYVATGATIF